MTAVIDYDAGNIMSVVNALKALGQDAVLTGDPETIRKADRVILPGVGAFGDAMQKIRARGLEKVIREVCDNGTPFLGICLGQQLLFESSEESEGAAGLGILKGTCRRIRSDAADAQGNPLKVPQIGWNDLLFPKDDAAENTDGIRMNPQSSACSERRGRLFRNLPEHPYVYFVHSYYADPADRSVIAASVDYGGLLTASVERDNVFACQFHPEKSAETGMQILRNFIAVRREEFTGRNGDKTC